MRERLEGERSPQNLGCGDAALRPEERPAGAHSQGTFWGLFGRKTAREGEACELLPRVLSACFSKAPLARINKFLWFTSRTKLGLSKDFFSIYPKSRSVSAPSHPFYPNFFPLTYPRASSQAASHPRDPAATLLPTAPPPFNTHVCGFAPRYN